MKPGRLLAVTLIALLATVGCSKSDSEPKTSRAKKTASLHLVESAPVTVTQSGVSVERLGTLRARRALKVLTQEEGRIVELPFYEGDTVHQGDLLVRIDDTLLSAELQKASAQRRQAELDLHRLQRLQAKKLVAEEELARARTALDVARAEEKVLSTRLAHTREQAPFNGIVSDRLAEVGDIVPQYTHVLTLLDPSSLVTDVTVSELLLPTLQVGDAVEVHIDALGGQAQPGKIRRLPPNVDPATRQGRVEVALAPVPAGARAGQLCRVHLQTHPVTRRTIPFAALRSDANGNYVFRLGADHTARRQPVVTGLQLADRIEILDGLKEGDRVVVKGFLNLTDGMTVKTVTPR